MTTKLIESLPSNTPPVDADRVMNDWGKEERAAKREQRLSRIQRVKRVGATVLIAAGIGGVAEGVAHFAGEQQAGEAPALRADQANVEAVTAANAAANRATTDQLASQTK